MSLITLSKVELTRYHLIKVFSSLYKLSMLPKIYILIVNGLEIIFLDIKLDPDIELTEI